MLFLLLLRSHKHTVSYKIRRDTNSNLPSSGKATFLTDVNVRNSPSTKGEVAAVYYKGESVNYDKIVENEGKTWISYISKTGIRRYCCAISSSGQYYISVATPELVGGLPIPLYYQYNYQNPYGDATIAKNGCGPTSFAMIASYLLGKTITPPDAIEWCGNSYYQNGVGTYWSYFAKAAQHFKCGSVTQTADASKAYAALKKNQPVICSQGKGIFTTGGHFIVLRGATGTNGVLVNDPNDKPSKNFKNRVFNFDTEVASTAKQYWIFEAKK